MRVGDRGSSSVRALMSVGSVEHVELVGQEAVLEANLPSSCL